MFERKARGPDKKERERERETADKAGEGTNFKVFTSDINSLPLLKSQMLSVAQNAVYYTQYSSAPGAWRHLCLRY